MQSAESTTTATCSSLTSEIQADPLLGRLLVDTFDDPKVELENLDLWAKYYQFGNEIRISKIGGRILPYITFRISGLHPTARYFLYMDIFAVDDKKYVHTADGWINVNQRNGQTKTEIEPLQMYRHPSSLATGEELMQTPISFELLRVTNSNGTLHEDQNGNIPIRLQINRKYQPRLHLVRVADDTFRFYVFKCTEFISVATYKNEAIRQLKKSYIQAPIYSQPFVNPLTSLQQKQQLLMLSLANRGTGEAGAASATGMGMERSSTATITKNYNPGSDYYDNNERGHADTDGIHQQDAASLALKRKRHYDQMGEDRHERDDRDRTNTNTTNKKCSKGSGGAYNLISGGPDYHIPILTTSIGPSPRPQTLSSFVNANSERFHVDVNEDLPRSHSSVSVTPHNHNRIGKDSNERYNGVQTYSNKTKGSGGICHLKSRNDTGPEHPASPIPTFSIGPPPQPRIFNLSSFVEANARGHVLENDHLPRPHSVSSISLTPHNNDRIGEDFHDWNDRDRSNSNSNSTEGSKGVCHPISRDDTGPEHPSSPIPTFSIGPPPQLRTLNLPSFVEVNERGHVLENENLPRPHNVSSDPLTQHNNEPIGEDIHESDDGVRPASSSTKGSGEVSDPISRDADPEHRSPIPTISIGPPPPTLQPHNTIPGTTVLSPLQLQNALLWCSVFGSGSGSPLSTASEVILAPFNVDHWIQQQYNINNQYPGYPLAGPSGSREPLASSTSVHPNGSFDGILFQPAVVMLPYLQFVQTTPSPSSTLSQSSNSANALDHGARNIYAPSRSANGSQGPVAPPSSENPVLH